MEEDNNEGIPPEAYADGPFPMSPAVPGAISPAIKSPTPEVASVRTPTPARSPSIRQARSPSPSSAKSLDKKSILSNNSAKSPKSLSLLTHPASGKQTLDDHIQELSLSVKRFSKDIEEPPAPVMDTNIDKIANMSKFLTQEANALRQSIRTLSEDIVKTKQELLAGYGAGVVHQEDVNFPYHLFLIEIIVNKIHMKCECFDVDFNNLVITATFLGKPPVVLYDPSYGKLENMSKLNVGKSTLFAMTYDKICSINDFEIIVELTKQPPCSSCITRIGETHMDYTKEFFNLRDDLCKKWVKEKPNDDILCTTSTPLSKNLYYLSCGDSDHSDSIGVIEITVRMSFLGKEITTTFCGSSNQTSKLTKEDNGMAMYSCQKVEMDDQDRILLDEGVFNNNPVSHHGPAYSGRSPTVMSEMSMASTNRQYGRTHYNNNTYNRNTYNGMCALFLLYLGLRAYKIFYLMMIRLLKRKIMW